MFVHIWRMKGRKKKAEEYEKFGRQVTLPALKKIDGCLDAQFIKVFEARKPEYLWLVFWRDKNALEAARTNPAWRDQIKRFEAGKFYKTIPLELVCESLSSFAGTSVDRLAKAEKAEAPRKNETAPIAENGAKAGKRAKPKQAAKAEKNEETGKGNKARKASRVRKAAKAVEAEVAKKTEEANKTEEVGQAEKANKQGEDSGEGFVARTVEGE